jgi:hypothetical protein
MQARGSDSRGGNRKSLSGACSNPAGLIHPRRQNGNTGVAHLKDMAQPGPEMKNAIAMTLSALIVICALASAASGQSTLQPSGTAASLNHHDAAKQIQTITGRIIRMDGESGLISVRASDSGKVIDLKAGRDLIARLRRGERVVVSYSGKTAIGFGQLDRSNEVWSDPA